jgi:hypothetical protein
VQQVKDITNTELHSVNDIWGRGQTKKMLKEENMHFSGGNTFWIKKQEVLGRTNRPLFFDTTRTAYKTTRPTVLLLLRVCSLPR